MREWVAALNLVPRGWWHLSLKPCSCPTTSPAFRFVLCKTSPTLLLPSCFWLSSVGYTQTIQNSQTLHGRGSRGIRWRNIARSSSRRKVRRRRRDSGGAGRNTPARGSCEEPNSWKPKINLNSESIRSGEWVNWGEAAARGRGWGS